jgi:hypothetical protein
MIMTLGLFHSKGRELGGNHLTVQEMDIDGLLKKQNESRPVARFLQGAWKSDIAV